MVSDDSESGAMLPARTRVVRWGCALAAMVLALAGCGGGDGGGGTLSADAQVQRDQAAAGAQVLQSIRGLMSALVQPGSGTENFEAGMADWQNWGNAQVIAGAGPGGSNALQIGPGAGGAALQVPGIVGGTTYRFTAQVRVKDLVNGQATIGVDFYDASGGRLTGTPTAHSFTNPATARLTFEVPAPANAAYALVWIWKSGDTGFAYLDDVAFAPVDNLLSNGGFEAGMAAWGDWGNTHVVHDPVNSGASALSVGPEAGGAGNNVDAIVEGTTYRLVAHAKVSDESETLFVGVNFLDRAGSVVGNALLSTTSTSYVTLTADTTAAPGAVRAMVYVWKNGGSGVGYVDDYAFAVASSAPPPPPPPPSDGNLVSNGGFEAGMTGWSDWGNTHVSTGQANSGTAALSVGPAAGGAGYNVDGIVPGTAYRFSVSAKVSDASDKVFVGVNFVDAAGALVTSTQRSTTSTTYTPLTADSIAPTGAVRAVVYVWKDAGSGVAYVDDFAFGVVSGSPPPPPTGANLLLNGTFENGLASWVNWGNATTSSQAAAGTSAAQVGTGAGGLGQNVSGIVAGNTYRVTAQVKVSSADEIGYLGLKFLDAAGNSLQDAVVPFTSTSYASAQVELVAPPNVTTALAYVWKNAGSGFAFVDEVELRGASAQPPNFPVNNDLQRVTTATDAYTSAYGQDHPSVARLVDGGYVVVWSEVYSAWCSQRYSAGAVPIGGKSCTPAYLLDNQIAAAALADGGWVVVWQVQGTTWVQRFRADGTAAEVPHNPTLASRVTSPRVTALPGGGYLVRWAGVGANYFRQYDASGAPLGPESRINTSQFPMDIAVLADGSFVAAWVTPFQSTTHSVVFAHMASLTQGGPETIVSVQGGTPVGTEGVSVAALKGGGFVLTWVASFPNPYHTAPQDQAVTQQFSASGVPVGDQTVVRPITLPYTTCYYPDAFPCPAEIQHTPAVAALTDGGYAVAVSSMSQHSESFSSAFVRRFSADGVPLAPATEVRAYRGAQPTVAIAGGLYGDFLVSLSDGYLWVKRYAADAAQP